MMSPVMTTLRTRGRRRRHGRRRRRARGAGRADVGAEDVGEHLGHVVEGERVVTHFFACTRPGYLGWRWAVTVARAPRQKTVTVDEVVLLPGDEAIVAPEWVPCGADPARRPLARATCSPSRRTTRGWSRRTPSATTRSTPTTRPRSARSPPSSGSAACARSPSRAATSRPQRWYDGDGGPEAPLAQSAPDACSTCGFLVRIAGPLSEMFGVCANGSANDDGRVVSLDHGCGAHSEVQLAKKHEPQPLPDHVFDTVGVDELETF